MIALINKLRCTLFIISPLENYEESLRWTLAVAIATMVTATYHKAIRLYERNAKKAIVFC
jgi:hypothetical protein